MRILARRFIFFCIVNFFVLTSWTWYIHLRPKDRSNFHENKLNIFLRLFEDLFASSKSKLCVVDSSVLWKFLRDDKSTTVLKRYIHVHRESKHDRVLSLALFQEHVSDFVKECKNFNLETEFIANHRGNISHIFLSKEHHVLHIVVFQKRNSYLWHDEVSNSPFGEIDRETHLEFSKKSFYENFSVVRLPLVEGRRWPLGIPQDISHFLIQKNISRFVPCLGSSEEKLVVSKNETTTSDQVPKWFFVKTVQKVIKELKQLLGQTPFWLSSGTLLGWYRDCDIIPYTSDADFSAWAEDFTPDLIKNIQSGDSIKMLGMLGEVEEDLELVLIYQWLRVDLFFTYRDQDTNKLYVGGHNSYYKYSFRYLFPEFTLCSAEFLEMLVRVPCNPEAVIEAEYGKNWRQPEKEWYYEASARNVKGRRYWRDAEIRRPS